MKLTAPLAVGNPETRTSQAKTTARPARVSAFGPEVPHHFFWLLDILAVSRRLERMPETVYLDQVR